MTRIQVNTWAKIKEVQINMDCYFSTERNSVLTGLIDNDNRTEHLPKNRQTDSLLLIFDGRIENAKKIITNKKERLIDKNNVIDYLLFRFEKVEIENKQKKKVHRKR